MTKPSGTLDPSIPFSGIDGWRERLLRFSSVATGSVILASPFIYWVVGSIQPNVLGIAVVFGTILLALPFANFVSVTARSWVYCFGLIVVVGAVALRNGFTPTFVGGYNLLLLSAGLLLGKRAMVLITVFGVGGLLLAGFAVDAGKLVIETAGRDPSEMRNWIRVSAMFGVASLAVVAIVRYATRTVNDQYARVQRELARARELRSAAEQVREARLARERELRGKQKLQAVGALSGGLAHLFNNALTVVQSVVESLKTDSSKSSRAQAKERLTKAMEPAVRVTQDLMIFSRKDLPEPQSIELGPLVADFAETLCRTIPEDVNLQISSFPGMTVAADPASLKQMLVNLVLNAADATGIPGNVRITVAPYKEEQEPDVRWVAIAVEDDGSGMNDSTLSQALDPFYTSKEKHSGLGLPVAHAIATQAGGELRLESQEGAGTRAVVLLPLERARNSVNPEALWPVASALHGRSRLRTIDALEPAAGIDIEPPQEPAWQDEVTRRLGRMTATAMAALSIVVMLLVPGMRPSLLIVSPIAVGLMAAAGWARFLPGNVARVCLIGGFWILGAVVVFRASFDNMAGMSIILLAIAWAGLLGRRWDGLVTVALTLVSFLVFGALHSGPLSIPPASNSDLGVAANWFRFAPQLGFYSLVLSASVLGALAAASRGAKSEEEALKRVEELRRQEAEEGARLLALEARDARSERVEAAGQAAGTVAHDLLNAVQTLTGTIEVLALSEGADEEQATLLTSLANAAGYAEALTTQFNSVSPTLNAGGHYPVCDVSSMITTMASLMQRVLPDRIKLISVVESDLVARVSETDLRRLVFNLVSNARDAIEDTGTINIFLGANDGRITLRVSDTGCGMDDATKARIFDPFFSSKAPGRGTGLGLHSVDDVVRRTHGSIEVESRIGHGSSFSVSWPAESREVAPARAQPAEQAQTAGSGGIILLAEDEPLVRKIMVETLLDAGYEVVEACDGDEGKRLALENTNYAAACIDGVMPGASSAEVIDCFQQAHPGRPVLLCSGYMPAELANRGLLKEGVTFLAKPFAPSRLQHELKTVIEQSA
jgi:signal transduction histidine kinase/CheY-like chemotaxis protein